MEIAALVAFAALLIAWIVAPDGRSPEPSRPVAEAEIRPVTA